MGEEARERAGVDGPGDDGAVESDSGSVYGEGVRDIDGTTGECGRDRLNGDTGFEKAVFDSHEDAESMIVECEPDV